MSRDQIRTLTRQWVNLVLYHDRDDRGRIVPAHKGEAEPVLSTRETAWRWHVDLGWPEHRIRAKLNRKRG